MYEHSAIAEHFSNCSVEYFKPKPNRILFNLVFKVSKSNRITGRDVVSTFMQVAPTVKEKGYNYFHIGGLYLRRPDPNKRTTRAARRTAVPPGPASRRVTRVPQGSQTINVIYEFYEMSFQFNLYNFTYNPELSDSKSELFQSYNSRVCSDLLVMLKNSSLKDNLRNCKLVAFRNEPNTIEFSLKFYKSSMTNLQNSVLRVLEDKVPHIDINNREILKLGGLHLIWQGFTINIGSYNTSYKQSAITIVILYEAVLANLTIGVFNLTYSPQLKDHNSQVFLRYESSMCKGFGDIFKNPDSAWPLHSCDMISVQPNPPSLNVHLIFVKPLADEQGILTQMNRSATHVNINGLDLIRLGEAMVDLSQSDLSLKPVNLSIPTTWNSSIPSDAFITQFTPLNPNSVTYKHHQVLLHDATEATLTLQVLNMSFIPDFDNISSTEFLDFQNKLCSNITQIFRRTLLARHYYMCNVHKISSSPLTVSIRLVFVAPYDDSLQRNVTRVLKIDVPHQTFAGKDALRIDNILLDWSSYNMSLKAVNVTDKFRHGSVWNKSDNLSRFNTTTNTDVIKYEATLVNLTYELSNLQYTNYLANSSSEQFQKYSTKFCKEVDEVFINSILSTAYHGCRLQKFSTDPNSVMFQLAFRVPKSSTLTKNITKILEKNDQRKADQKTWLLHFGGLSLMQNTVQVSSIVFNITGSSWPERSLAYDGWLVQLTLRPSNLTYRDDFKNTSSSTFKEYSHMLCNAVDRMYAKSNLSQHYAGCKIEDLRDKPVKVIFQLIFRQGENFIPKEIVSVFRDYRETGSNVAPIGKAYFYIDKMSLAYKPTKVPDADPCNPDNNRDHTRPCNVGLLNEPVIKN